MTPPEKPLLYLILGAAGSGRREVLADLIEAGLEAGDRAAVLLSETEDANDFDAKLPRIVRWAWRDDRIEGVLPDDATRIFFITDGRQNPVEQLDVLKAWLDAHGIQVARTICLVNCQLAEKNPPLLAWYEACVHFSDVVLLNKREGVENKWLSGFLTYFKKRFYPCLFETVKGGRVHNPALILDPVARRMSHVFDEEQDWVFTDAAGEEIDEQEETEGEEEIEAKPEEDPYFARDAAGRRVKRLPDIRKFL